MVLPGDPRHQFETDRLLASIAQPNNTVICCYPDERLVAEGNRLIRELIRPVIKDIRRHTITLDNGTVIRLIRDDQESAETRGRTNYIIIR
jgi:hypothetical protein